MAPRIHSLVVGLAVCGAALAPLLACPPAPPSGDDAGPPDAGTVAVLAINELVAKNETSFLDNAGDVDDWFELVNLTAAELDVSGYRLSDARTFEDVLTFAADTRIAANGFLVVVADGQPEQSTPLEPHAPFKLSADGEEVALADADGTLLDLAVFPALGADQAFGRDADGAGTFGVLPYPTPGRSNASDPTDAGTTPTDAGPCVPPFEQLPAIVVNEALAADSVPGTAPFIELLNRGDASVDLGGLVLADDAGLLRTWPLPAQALGAGERVVFVADDRPDDGPLHAGLLLDATDTAVALADLCGAVVDVLPLDGQRTGNSVGRAPDGSATVAVDLTPTPGTANHR